MRLVAHEFMTLDGVMQGPGGVEEDPTGGFRWGGWGATIFDDVVGEVVDSWFQRTSALLFGRTTYAMMAEYWPQVTDPADTVAARLNASPKHVVSTTLADASGSADAGRLAEVGGPWAPTTEVIAHDVPARIRALKETGDGELQVHGSWQLLQTLLAERLVDELRLIVAPVVLGEGKRVFDAALPTGFEVTDARLAPGGCVALTLVPGALRIGTFEVVDGVERLVGEQEVGAESER